MSLPRATAVVELLKQRHQTVATCESLTGGLAGATIAGVPGASSVFRGGIITYATELKHELAGVPDEVLAAEGPVSPVTARYMAQGAKFRCAGQWGLSFTGVAGPSTQDGHPVGEVWIGISGPSVDDSQLAGHILGGGDVLVGDREEIRKQAVQAGLELLLRALN